MRQHWKQHTEDSAKVQRNTADKASGPTRFAYVTTNEKFAWKGP
jgi:hypothetical protein